MYKLTDVKKDYPKGRQTVHALQGVDLEIADGEWMAIQGPTGHGKSTLLQILGGLDRATSGSVLLDGTDLTRLGEGSMTKTRATTIGFIFQTFNLIPTLTAQENVETALVPLGAGGRGAGLGRPGRPGPPPAVGALRRPAAARGDRPRAGEGAQGATGGRAG